MKNLLLAVLLSVLSSSAFADPNLIPGLVYKVAQGTVGGIDVFNVECEGALNMIYAHVSDDAPVENSRLYARLVSGPYLGGLVLDPSDSDGLVSQATMVLTGPTARLRVMKGAGYAGKTGYHVRVACARSSIYGGNHYHKPLSLTLIQDQ